MMWYYLNVQFQGQRVKQYQVLPGVGFKSVAASGDRHTVWMSPCDSGNLSVLWHRLLYLIPTNAER